MSTPAEVDRIQSYLRESARGQYEALAIPPFTLFFHPSDTFKYFNYAIPDVPITGNFSRSLTAPLFAPLRQLRAAFRARGRTPRFEFFEAFAPELPAALRENRFIEEARQWSMLCAPETLREAPAVPGLEVTPLTAGSPDADIRDFLIAQRQGFDPEDTSTPGAEDIARTRHNIEIGGRRFLARLEGQPAGVSAFSRPIDGVTELAGIATRVPFRRQGIAAYLTWYATRAAFDLGVQTACLTAEDARAGRVYERAGYHPFSVMLAYIDGESRP